VSSYTSTSSFTVTHAKYLASKVAADLRQLQRLYGAPPDDMIADYLLELSVLLSRGYLSSVQYGFRRNGNWILALSYSVNSEGNLVADARSGGVFPSADVGGAVFHSYLFTTSAWHALSSAEQISVQSLLPFERVAANEPGTEGGYWVESDRTYASGGVGVVRRTYRPW